MTYPPQGPDPWGQQGPDPWGQQGPPPGGFPQGPPSGGFPAAGGQPPPGYDPSGQPPPYGQPPPGYGPPGHPGGGPPGYPGGEPPKKPKTGLIIGIVAGALVLLGGGTTALIFLLGGGGVDIDDMAEEIAEGFNERDYDQITDLECGTADDIAEENSIEEFEDNIGNLETQAGEVKFSAGGEPEINGDEATVFVNMTPEDIGMDFKMKFKAIDGSDGWCAQRVEDVEMPAEMGGGMDGPGMGGGMDGPDMPGGGMDDPGLGGPGGGLDDPGIGGGLDGPGMGGGLDGPGMGGGLDDPGMGGGLDDPGYP